MGFLNTIKQKVLNAADEAKLAFRQVTTGEPYRAVDKFKQQIKTFLPQYEPAKQVRETVKSLKGQADTLFSKVEPQITRAAQSYVQRARQLPQKTEAYFNSPVDYTDTSNLNLLLPVKDIYQRSLKANVPQLNLASNLTGLPKTIAEFGQAIPNMLLQAPKNTTEGLVETPLALLKKDWRGTLKGVGKAVDLPLQTFSGGEGGVLINNARKQILKELAIHGAKKGTKLGAVFGFQQALKDIKDTDTLQDVLKKAGVNTTLGAGGGLILGAGTPVMSRLIGKTYSSAADLFTDIAKMSPQSRAAFLQAGFLDITSGNSTPQKMTGVNATDISNITNNNLRRRVPLGSYTNIPEIDNPLLKGRMQPTKTPIAWVTKLLQRRDKNGIAEPMVKIIDEYNQIGRKVNLLDYFRTPDRVLKKVGMEDEAKMLRAQYDKYLVELPKEIDRITAWSKRVSPEGNLRIFRYLDGKYKTLKDPEELKVATEIQGYLKTWAKRLGLPEDRQVSDYITHIFEKGQVEKEFDPELAKLIRGKVVKSVYDPFLQKRVNRPEYIEDTWRALDAYVKRGTRKWHMDPVLEKVAAKAENLPPESYNYIKGRIARINMQPTDIDNLIDNAVKASPIGYRLGQRPVTATTQKARQMVFRGLLGLNPGSALRNLQQSTNTYAAIGEKHFGIGLVKTLQNTGKYLTNKPTELEEVGVLGKDIIQDRVLSSTHKFWQQADEVLFYLFNQAEKFNRSVAYYGAKSKALSQGKSEQAAIDFAKEIVRKTQFNYDVIDTPAALQSDIAKTLFQFAKYPLAQTEFLTEMVKRKDIAGSVRWLASNLLFIATAGKALGLDYKDMFPQFRFGTPPTLQLPQGVVEGVVGAADEYGNVPEGNMLERTLKNKNVQKGFVNYIPAGGQIKKTLGGIQAIYEGGSYTPSGRQRFSLDSLPSKIQGVLLGIWATPEGKAYLKNRENVATTNPEKSAQEFNKSLQKQEATERRLAGKIYTTLKETPKEDRKAILSALIQQGVITDTVLSELTRLSNENKKSTQTPFVKAVDMIQTNEGRATFIRQYLKDRPREEKRQLLEELITSGTMTKDLYKKLLKGSSTTLKTQE